MDASDTKTATEALRLMGASNFRDFGGYPAADGQRVRCGMLFRSNDLHKLTPSDLERLRPIAIKLICDLRGSLERQCRPSQWPDDVITEYLLANVSGSPESSSRHYESEFAHIATPGDARKAMVDVYRHLPTRCASSLREIVQRLSAGEVPALIHCTAGKDRTGFICAALLHVLGVPRDTIYADYLLTTERLNFEHMLEAMTMLQSVMPMFPASAPREVLEVVHGVEAEYLDASFEAVNQQHGSLDAYLVAIGVTEDLQHSLRGRLLEPAVRYGG